MDTRTLAARHFAWAFAIALAVLVLYAPVRGFDYLNFDDNEYVTENPFVRGGLSLDNARAAFTHARGGHYHPLTWLSHMLDVSLFGLRAGPAHVVNVVFHAATTALLFLLVCRCLAAPGLAAAVALLFGAHPMRLESVAWLAGRKDVLSLFFALATLHAWVSYAQRPSPRRYLGVGVLFALGLLCKPTLVTLPLLLLAFDRWPLARAESLARLLREKVPLAALSVASVVTTAWTQAREGAVVGLPGAALDDRAATAALAYLAYLGKLFWPAGLAIFYPLTKYAPGIGAGAVVALAALSYGCLSNARRYPALAFGWVWFVVAPLPVIGLVQFGGQAFADRWSYLPHLGLVLGLVATVHGLLRPRARVVGAVVAVVACAVVTARALPHWRNSETVFRHALAVVPDNFMAHTNLGNALDQAGKLDEAAVHYEEAVRLNPTYPEALNNLGTLKARRGEMDAAEALFRRALAVRPGMLLARYNLGLAASSFGRNVEAATEWLRLLADSPGDVRAWPSLQFVVIRTLSPACQAGKLRASAAEADAFRAALARWQPAPAEQDLRAALEGIARCL